jgi:hypothetical protein
MLSSYYPLQEPYENYVINKEGIIKNTLRNNHVNKCWKNSKGYLYFCLWNYKTQKKKHFFKHRLLAIAFITNPYNLPIIDHIDRNPLNNNIENLRWCDRSENSVNRETNNPLGRGILKSRNGKRFTACLYRNNKKKHIGTYDTLLEAKNNRLSAEKIYYKNKIIKILPIII